MEEVTKERRAEEFARSFVHLFWSGDEAGFARALAPDFTWIAAQDERYKLDRAQSIALFHEIASATPEVILVEEEYTTVIVDGDVTVVVGTYYGINNPETGFAFSARQRLSMILRDAPRGFQIVHLHVSYPVSISRKGEYFPVGFSREAYRYVRMLASQYSDRASIEVREIGGATHVLRTFDVVYLEADRQYTMIHCLGKTLRARQGIGVLSQRFPQDRFFEVRRGCIVNILHVVSWDATSVRLTGGIEIPIPARRSTQVREQIEELRKLLVGGGGYLSLERMESLGTRGMTPAMAPAA